ncbi:hypothetical protein H0H92_003564 [Tricholoma furcatifolium]|nr:hypothetical protein H0H92_003564 [Tricholoma furcatifolium]
MDNNKSRRPLPTPGAVPSQRPNTPVTGALNSASVSPASFYASPKPIPPPTRSATIGSSHTTYVAPVDPPPYRSASATGFREPELVPEEPEQTPVTSTTQNPGTEYWYSDNNWTEDSWNQSSLSGSNNNNNNNNNGWSGDFGNYNLGFNSATKEIVTIDGRSEWEEKNWWIPSVRDSAQRPGPGMLPTVLAEELHNPDHSLFSVHVTNPDIKPNPPPVSAPPAPSAEGPDTQGPAPAPARNAWASPPSASVSPPPLSASPSTSASASPPAAPNTSTTAPPPPPPTESDVRTAVPHPNAYYCPKENGWVILSWKSSAISPPYARSFVELQQQQRVHAHAHPLPDQERRRRTTNCLGEQGQHGQGQQQHQHQHQHQPLRLFDTNGLVLANSNPNPNSHSKRTHHANATHHFHKYARAVDAHRLTPPLRMEAWERAKLVRRAATIIGGEIDVGALGALDPRELDAMEGVEGVCLGVGGDADGAGDGEGEGEGDGEAGDRDADAEGEGRLLDLYICCQCQLYCVASGVIPGVIPRKCFDEFVRDKRSNPPVGQTGEAAVGATFETILKVIENKLWKGENRLLRTDRPQFKMKIGWGPNAQKTLEALGFTEESFDGQPALRPPPTDTASPAGRANRRRLLRAWVEVSAWLADFRRSNATVFRDLPEKKQLWVQIESAREMYQTAIGAHPDQARRGDLTGTLLQIMQQHHLHDWAALGLTPMSYTPELLTFAYHAQARCDPARTVDYFSALTDLVATLQSSASASASDGDGALALAEVLATERSRDRFTRGDARRAAETLGFGEHGVLGVEYTEADVPEGFLANAWRECVKRAWRDPGPGGEGAELLRAANEAFRVLAEERGSEGLRREFESSKSRVMTPEKAYDTLEVPRDVDDLMLITVYNMRMDESPSQIEKMKDAMVVIAEVRDSQRLRQFLELGRDPGEIHEPTRPDLPRGLNQLGNTCYLNSLLQYFYTIKDLREAVSPMSKLDMKSVEDEKFSDDDLKRHRVGGRLVTRREITPNVVALTLPPRPAPTVINQLAELFFHLEYADQAAVTPSIDLAKLALVTSRDEEEDEADKGGTSDSSNDTDATLVDDALGPAPAARVAPPEDARSPTLSASASASVLGKRSRDVTVTMSTSTERQPSVMDLDLDSPVTFPSSPTREDMTLSSASTSRMSDSPPPLMSLEQDGHGHGPSMPEASGSGTSRNGQGDVEMKDATATAVVASAKPPPLPPRKATQTSDSVMMFGKQHDVAECMDNCMFQIETALLKFDGVSDGESSDKTSVVKRLFYGKLRQRLTGPQASRSSAHEKEDLFSHLPVNVTNDGVDIYDGLSGYFDDVVEFNGEKRRMEVTLVDLPPVLQIQLQRVQFNRETLQPYKSQAYVKFGETIYMDRFLDSADPEKKARSKAIQARLNTVRERTRLLVEGKDTPFLSALEHTADLVSRLPADVDGVDDDLRSALSDEQKVLKDEIDALRSEADSLKDELETVWRDDTEMAYELTSVFIHRGSTPSFGHYFFYSRHLPDQPDSWFKYNDSDVTVVSKEEVLADTTGSTANPYLLVFARKGSEVVDTVKRFDPSKLEDA